MHPQAPEYGRGKQEQWCGDAVSCAADREDDADTIEAMRKRDVNTEWAGHQGKSAAGPL